MSQFDALLDDVLSGYANPPAPSRLEAGVLAGLSAPARTRHLPQHTWTGIAASIGLALVTWLSARTYFATTVHPATVAHVDATPHLAANRHMAVPTPRTEPVRQKRVAGMRPHTPLRADVAHVAPVALDSLWIPPIEIAPLAHQAPVMTRRTKRTLP